MEQAKRMYAQQALQYERQNSPSLSTFCSLPLAKPRICQKGIHHQSPLQVSVAGSAEKRLLPWQGTSSANQINIRLLAVFTYTFFLWKTLSKPLFSFPDFKNKPISQNVAKMQLECTIITAIWTQIVVRVGMLFVKLLCNKNITY